MHGTPLGTAGVIHLAAAVWVLCAGGIQLLRTKGTPSHRMLGWSWMLAIVVVSVSSFWLHELRPVFFGLGPIHILSIWVLICVVVSVYSARHDHIIRHRNFAVGAYLGAVVAGSFAIYGSNRLLHQWLFGA